MPNRDNLSWMTLIVGHTQRQLYVDTVLLYVRMLSTGTLPNQCTFTSVLSSCTKLSDFELGKRIHSHVICLGLEASVGVCNVLMDMYGKFGSIKEAEFMFNRMPIKSIYSWNTLLGRYAQSGHLDQASRFFEEMPEKDVVPWNSMISACSNHGLGEEAVWLFIDQMNAGIVLDFYSFVTLVTVSANMENLKLGKTVHAFAIKTAFDSHDHVENALVSMYGKCGSMDDAGVVFDGMNVGSIVAWTAMLDGYVKLGNMENARYIFDRMPERDVVAWTVMMSGYSHHKKDNKVVQLFQELVSLGLMPSSYTYSCILGVVSRMASLGRDKAIHAHAFQRGLAEKYASVENSLITMYAKGGNLYEAHIVFRSMSVRESISWMAIIMADAPHGLGKEALRLFEEIQAERLKLDHLTYLGVLMACTHAGLLDGGRAHFDSMYQKYHIAHQVYHYACMVLGRAGCLDEAMSLIESMPMKHDVYVWGSLLGACRLHNNSDLAKHAVDNLLELDPENAGVYALMANIYASLER